MSETIVHTAIADDTRRLLLAARDVSPAFHLALEHHPDMVRLGSCTRSGDKFTVSLLDAFRTQLRAGTAPADLAPKIAFVLGWLAHRATDRQFKPTFRQAEPEKTQSPRECSVYHEAFTFREVYGNGAHEPFRSTLLERDPTPDEQAELERFDQVVQGLLQRALISLHTFIPDDNDVEGWIDRMFQLRQRFYVDLQRYRNALLRPDPELTRRYIHDTNFYNRDEPLLALAARLRAKQSVARADVRAALDQPADSQYACAIALSAAYIEAADDFIQNTHAPDWLNVKLNCGRPGRDGLGV